MEANSSEMVLKSGDIVRLLKGTYAGLRARIVSRRGNSITVILAKSLRPLIVEVDDCRFLHARSAKPLDVPLPPSEVSAFRFR